MGNLFTPEEKIKRALERHPDWEDWRIARTAGHCSVNAVRAIRGGNPILPSKTETKAAGLVSLESVISRYDTKAAIKKELDALPEGQLISESELALRAAGSDRSRFRRTVENNAEEFRPYRIKLKIDESTEGRWYWGSREDVAEAQRIRDL